MYDEYIIRKYPSLFPLHLWLSKLSEFFEKVVQLQKLCSLISESLSSKVQSEGEENFRMVVNKVFIAQKTERLDVAVATAEILMRYLPFIHNKII